MLFGVIPFPTIAMIVFCIVLAYVMRYTPFGRNVYAVGGNEEAARIAGIKTDNVTINVYGNFSSYGIHRRNFDHLQTWYSTADSWF